MKNFLLLLIVLLLAAGGAYQFYLKDHPPAWMQRFLPGSSTQKDAAQAEAKPVGKKDFKEVSARLQGDMDHLPMTLRDTRQMPLQAFDIRSKVAPYLQLHEEYRTLTQVCDTIIAADQDFAQRQGKCGLGPLGPGATGQERARTAAGPDTTVYPPQQALWEVRRRQADAEVRAQLATLENHRL